MTKNIAQRHPHAVLDLPSRRQKALKIERLLNLSTLTQPIKLLEIGTGSGGIAHYFAYHEMLNCHVDAVDVIDQRLQHDGFAFHLVQDTALPFPDAHFDVVISNHVIEHVGDSNAQANHLKEIQRVMRLEGIGYLAVPNRWMMIEPHYRLAFLSWLPPKWRSPYLRAMKRGEEYDCNPPSMWQLENLLAEIGFSFKNLSSQALHETLNIEGSKGLIAAAVAELPEWLLDKLASINPTLIYKLTLI